MRVRIEEGQVRWPKRMAEVSHVGHDRVAQAHREGIRVQPAQSAIRPLRLHGQISATRRERQQRQLLQQQPGKALDRQERGLACLPPKVESLGWRNIRPKRPVVPQQQHERQGDDLRLRHQAHRKQQRDDKISANRRLARIPAIRDHRQQEENHGEHGFAFRYPGDRFDVHGMQRKYAATTKLRPT